MIFVGKSRRLPPRGSPIKCFLFIADSGANKLECFVPGNFFVYLIFVGKSRRQVLYSSLFGLFISDEFFVTLTQGVSVIKCFYSLLMVGQISLSVLY